MFLDQLWYCFGARMLLQGDRGTKILFKGGLAAQLLAYHDWILETDAALVVQVIDVVAHRAPMTSILDKI